VLQDEREGEARASEAILGHGVEWDE